MKTIKAKVLFIALLLSTATPFLPAIHKREGRVRRNNLYNAVEGGT